MKYIKNSELSEMYKVSDRTIRNWITASEQNKIPLKTVQDGERTYILNTPSNHTLMKQLSEQRRKFKNKRVYKRITPKKEFYDIFNENHISDIILQLENHKEIPLKYSYFTDGADYWDKYTNKLLKEEGSNILHNTLELLSKGYDDLISLTKGYDKVNVVDVGPGNGVPLKNTVQKLLDSGKLNKYIAIDDSRRMIDITRRNFAKWFPEFNEFVSYIKDIEYERFHDVLFHNKHTKQLEQNVVNLVFVLGGTIGNIKAMNRSMLLINDSLEYDDVFIYSKKLDTQNARIHFDFNAMQQNHDLREVDKLILNLIGIEDDFYDVEKYYDEAIRSRIVSITLKLDLEILFETDGFTKIVQLSKKDKIILIRAKHQNFDELINSFYESNFEILHTSRSQDTEELLVLSKIKRNDM